jgi:transposase-like protein
MENKQQPQTLLDAIRYFSDPQVCLQFVAEMRWPNGVECPTCGSKEVRFLANQMRWECKHKHPKKQFSVKIGTIFEDSALGLDKWLCAIWMIANAKNGISSYEIHRALGVTQKSAWFMLQRIRLAMQTGTFKKMSGEVEADETFIGGKARNMHPGKRTVKGRGSVGKTIVMGLLERHGEVRTTVIPNTRRKTLHGEVKRNVEAGSTLYTDAFPAYNGLDNAFAHSVIDHAESYVDGHVHTNGVENFWSLLKRMIKGTYVSVEPFHLFRYLDEEAFRFNNRKVSDGDRFVKVLESIEGKHLNYQELIGCPTQQ